MKRSGRLVCEKPYGVTTSASTAAASMTTTMAPPIVPSGFLRSIWTQTSAYQGRVLGGTRTATATAAPTEDVGSAGIELVFRVDDVWRAFRTLTGTGIAFEGEPAEQEWGAAHVWLRDPDGYRLSLYSEGPAS